MSRRWLAVNWSTLTLAAGLHLRLLHTGLPQPIVKYGGSALWAVLVTPCLPRCCPAARR